nr:polysaccharide pyruvyl transferase family protein [Carnobacterium maltaromaticum]
MPSVLSNKWINKLTFLNRLYYLIAILLNQKVKQQDLIIAAPGGYINSYYGFENKLFVLSLYKRILKKNIMMAPQSIGPLSKRDEKVITDYLPYFSDFLVRDECSYQRIRKLSKSKKIKKVYDAAFLFKPVGYSEKSERKRVAISVREWSYDNRNQETYCELIRGFVNELVKQKIEVVFLSTCQGNPEYLDDSLLAKKIKASLPKDIREFVTVDNYYYSLEELRFELTQYDFVIGTRLHMCILSWLSGTPALNISYEEKGKECYDYLELSEYSIDYNESGKSLIQLQQFIQLTEAAKRKHFSKIDVIHEEMKWQLNDLIPQKK